MILKVSKTVKSLNCSPLTDFKEIFKNKQNVSILMVFSVCFYKITALQMTETQTLVFKQRNF